jgi:hypothetical protein
VAVPVGSRSLYLYLFLKSGQYPGSRPDSVAEAVACRKSAGSHELFDGT